VKEVLSQPKRLLNRPVARHIQPKRYENRDVRFSVRDNLFKIFPLIWRLMMSTTLDHYHGSLKSPYKKHVQNNMTTRPGK